MATAPTVRRHILPPQVTPLERAVDQATPQWGGLADAVEPASVQANPAFQPWLAMQWQVAKFAPYFPDLGALLDNALPWLRERGNGASVRRAMGWLGYDTLALRIEEDGYLLHIDPGRLVTDADLLPLVRVVRASLPLHVSFYRVFHGEDTRALRYDSSRYDGAIWDNDSGTWVQLPEGEAPIKVSQYQTHTAVSSAPHIDGATTMGTSVRHTTVTSADALNYDAWAYDSEVMGDVAMGGTSITTTVVPTYVQLQPISMPGDAHMAQSNWPAPAPVPFGLGQALGQSPIPLDNTRGWRGTWDSATWAVVCPTITTRLED
ncbi:phage tail protein [Delftia acidovorans]|uniref:phage tail protein n=1 Tax=Delftia acidovorans TaxID=80866 RepID=UPI00242DECF4|nr:phage tail protein [Delftia acidovorans]